MSFILLIFLNLFSAVVIFLTSREGTYEKVKDFITPPPMMEHYAFGFKVQLADTIWIRSIQDFDFCDNQLTEKTCKGNSWLFHMLDTVVRLDPNYLNAYSAGGLALTVLISDFEGASKIFDKGTTQFPKDWVLNYRAAYHALYEEHDPDKAALLYQRAAENGGPEWGTSLANRLRTKEGRIEVAERMLQQMIDRNENEALINKLRGRIQEYKNEK